MQLVASTRSSSEQHAEACEQLSLKFCPQDRQVNVLEPIEVVIIDVTNRRSIVAWTNVAMLPIEVPS